MWRQVSGHTTAIQTTLIHSTTMFDKLSFLVVMATMVTVVTGYSGKVLLVSFDGFRWDYLNTIPRLDNFARLAKEGVKVPYMNATFSTVTFPNHYSIATGLYEESHGMVQNKMYDPLFDSWFRPGNVETRWWDGGEPIWISAVKRGKRSGAFHWAGSQAELQGLRPNFYTEYDKHTPWKERVDTVMSWFTEDRIDVGLLYYHEPDSTGHKFGPDSVEIEQAVQMVDDMLGYLFDEIERNGLEEELNLLVTSDHGMASVSMDRVIDLYDHIDSGDLEVVIDIDCVCMLQPKPGREQAVVDALTGVHEAMHVYRRHEIPDRWHYATHRRIFDVLVVMDESWRCVANVSSNRFIQFGKGDHGWDNVNMNMKPIFLARGPDFKSDHVAKTFNNVDIYPLMCELLNIEGASNNGSLDNTRDMLLVDGWGANTAAAATPCTASLTALGVLLTAAQLCFY